MSNLYKNFYLCTICVINFHFNKCRDGLINHWHISSYAKSYGQHSTECIKGTILLLDTQTQILPSRSSQVGIGGKVQHHV